MLVNTHTGERIPVMYNPEEYRLEDGNNFAEVGIPGLDAPPIQYVRGRGRALTMELFFDTYAQHEDVRRHTARITGLLEKLPQTNAPPILLFVMGQFAFECVLADATQRFTMFDRDGTPVRASLSARFLEFVRVQIETQRGVFMGPPTLHNVVEGQRVSDLAARYLGDPGKWRAIAEANGIDDPFRLATGESLVIPRGHQP
jgi:hypothetical protein